MATNALLYVSSGIAEMAARVDAQVEFSLSSGGHLSSTQSFLVISDNVAMSHILSKLDVLA